MGKFDEATYEYFSDPEYFADLINAGCFEGKEIVCADRLEQLSERTQEEGKKGPKSTYRDLRMRLRNGAGFVFLAVENQTEVDFEMPLRIMRYDAAEYQRQANAHRRKKRKERETACLGRSAWSERMTKDDRFYPVYTVCFYHGDGTWQGPRSLKELMDFGENAGEWEENFSDYRITVINANDRELAENCRTQLRQLLNVMSARRDKKRLRALFQEKDYANLNQETARIIAVMADVPEFLEREDEYQNAEGGYNMCQAMDELRAEFKEEGRAEGRAEGREQTLITAVRNLMTSMKLSMEQAMNALMIPEESRGRIRNLMKQ